MYCITNSILDCFTSTRWWFIQLGSHKIWKINISLKINVAIQKFKNRNKHIINFTRIKDNNLQLLSISFKTTLLDVPEKTQCHFWVIKIHAEKVICFADTSLLSKDLKTFYYSAGLRTETTLHAWKLQIRCGISRPLGLEWPSPTWLIISFGKTKKKWVFYYFNSFLCK